MIMFRDSCAAKLVNAMSYVVWLQLCVPFRLPAVRSVGVMWLRRCLARSIVICYAIVLGLCLGVGLALCLAIARASRV